MLTQPITPLQISHPYRNVLYYYSMGNNQPIIYSAEVPGQEQPQNSTKIRRHPDYLGGLVESLDPKLNTLQLILQKSFQTFANNTCIGAIVSRPSQTQGKEERDITYKTYGQVQKVSETLDKAIQDLNLSPTIEDVPGLKIKFIGIFSKNRAEWLEISITTSLQGYCLVPIYDTLGAENIPYILNQTNLTTLFCSKESLNVLLKCENLGAVKNIVSFDPIEDDTANKFKEKGVTMLQYQDLLSKYEKSDFKAEKRTLTPNQVVSFCYTSGTTGPPKGAMLSGKNFAAYTAALSLLSYVKFTEQDVHLSYLPLAHILENIGVLAVFVFGGTVVAYSGDIKNLKNDIELVRPTFFLSVPRLYNRFYDAVKKKFSQTQGMSKTILDKALQVKMNNVSTNGGYTHRLYDPLVFNKTKQLFGGRCRLLLSGSAPLTPEVHSFMKVISCAPLNQGYGQTESTGGSFITAPNDPNVGHVGGPTSMVEYKLLDIPEMNYTHNDKDQQGRSTPRGEIMIRGPGVFLGYYKDEAKTKQTITEDGWLHTGDVGTILPGSKALKIIDRKKNIFKLQQGEYVASERVEGVYTKREDMIQEMFLYGDSSQSFCVAVISPVKTIIESIAKAKNVQGSYEELCKNKDVRTEYLTVLNNFSKKNGLNGFEQPKNVFLEPSSFQDKNILTTTMKLQRFAAKNVYKQEIEAMYKEGILGGRPE